jgi:hypothetical protein
MGIGANFGRAVSRTDEPHPDGSVPSRVGGNGLAPLGFFVVDLRPHPASWEPPTNYKRTHMTAKFSNLLLKHLPRYQPEDGDTIDIVAFKYAFPSIDISFWESSLLGCGKGGRGRTVKRKPLKGRIKCKPGAFRVVILVDSLRTWLAEYSPDQTKSVDEIISDLKRISDKHDRYLAHLKQQTILKNGTARVKQKEKAPQEVPTPLVFDTKSVSEVLA